MIYGNKRENRTTFQIKTSNFLELLTPETIKLLGGTKSKITEDENGENVPYLEITKNCQQQLPARFKSLLNICS